MVISTRARPNRAEVAASLTIRDHLNTFFYYRKIAAMVFLAIAALGIVISLILPMPYRAQSTLLVLFAGYYDQSNDVRAPPIVPAVGQLVSVEAQILGSPELHRQVIQAELGPDAGKREFDKTLQDFQSRFHIEQNDLANTINLSYYDGDPKRAAHVLSVLLSKYFQQRANIFTSGRAAMLAGQRDEVRARLDKANADLLAFQKAHGVVNINDQISRAVALENLLVQRQMENNAALAQDRGGLAALRAATQDVRPDIMLFTDNSEIVRALAAMQATLVQLESRRSDLASRYMASSPFVQQLDKQIADLRANIAQEKRQLSNVTRYGHNSYYDTVQDRLAGLLTNISGEVARQKELAEQVGEAHKRSQNLIAVSDKLRQMQADRDLLADSFRERARQVELADIQQEQASQVNSTNVRVIQAPMPPTRRSVSTSLMMAASIVIALLVAALTVLLLASLRETFLSPEQAERSLLLPVLSAPIIALRRAAARLRGAAQPDKPQEPAEPAPGKLNARVAHKAYGRLASVIHGSSEAASKVVMVLAPSKDEGAHRVIKGAAIELERRSARPVLILDMSGLPGAATYGQAADEQELIDWPDVESGSGVPHAAQAEAVPDLDFRQVAQHGIVIARPREGAVMFSWEHAAALFDALRKDHEYVLVHAPATTQSFYGIENASLVDAVLLVLRAEVTRKPLMQSLKQQVLDDGGNIVGIAMTYRRAYIPAFFYRFFLNS
jgi:uncharacterized protein involved in exopolysaccharide biosynthesis